IVVIEKCAMAAAVPLGVRGRGIARWMLRRRLRERVRHQSGADRACANRRADQKGAARFIVLGHAEIPPALASGRTIRAIDRSMRRFRAGGKRWASRTDLLRRISL